MDFDKFLSRVGGFGKYQKIHLALLSLIAFPAAFSSMGYVFIAAVPNHWCAIPNDNSSLNLSLEELKLISLPTDDNGELSKCLIYDYTSVNRTGGNSSLARNASNLPVRDCSVWDYDTTQYTATIVSQWDLVCGKEWLAASIGAGIGIGCSVCALVTGGLADRFGRKKLLLASLALQGAVGILSAFAPDPISFGIALSIVSGCSLASYQSAFVLGIELVAVSWRVFAGTAVNVVWTLGYLCTAGIAYFIRDWTTLQIVLHASIAIFLVVYARFTPESIRWLLQTGRNDEAVRLMKEMANTNSISWDDKIMSILPRQQEQEVEEKVTFADLVKSRMMIVFTITSSLLWFSSNLLYFGLSYNTSNLAGNPYLNFAVSGAAEIPAYLCTYVMLKSKLGRRGSTVAVMLLSSVALLATIPVPDGFDILVTVLAMVGKCAISGGFAIVFLYTPELYPSSFRSLGMGISSTLGRIGIIVAPYIAMLGSVYFRELPLIVFGIFSLLAGCMTLLLPETKSVPLPETMEDLRAFKDHMISCKRLDDVNSTSAIEGHENAGAKSGRRN